MTRARHAFVALATTLGVLALTITLRLAITLTACHDDPRA